MKFGIIAVNNIYVEETTVGISDFTEIYAIILKNKGDKCNIKNYKEVNLTYIDKKSIISLLKLPNIIKKTNKFVDCFIVHYMNPYFALLIASGIINKPIVYFCYGGDVRKSRIRNWLVKKALERVDSIFVEIPSQKEYLNNSFGIPYDKLESSIIIFPVNPSFKKINLAKHQIIRKKWRLFKKHVIFSPRTIDTHYNHHILVEGISQLEDSLKKDTQIVLTGVGNIKYLSELIEFGKNNNLDIVNLGRFLTPQEMTEIYNISLINANIPKHDQFGRSIMEGCLCGTIPLLNVEIPSYHDYLKDEENCVFVIPKPEAIAKKVEWVIENQNDLKDLFYERNARIFLKYQETEKIYYDLTKTIEKKIKSNKGV